MCECNYSGGVEDGRGVRRRCGGGGEASRDGEAEHMGSQENRRSQDTAPKVYHSSSWLCPLLLIAVELFHDSFLLSLAILKRVKNQEILLLLGCACLDVLIPIRIIIHSLLLRFYSGYKSNSFYMTIFVVFNWRLHG